MGIREAKAIPIAQAVDDDAELPPELLHGREGGLALGLQPRHAARELALQLGVDLIHVVALREHVGRLALCLVQALHGRHHFDHASVESAVLDALGR
eukprot:6315093-Pyramimonas_sp.AAC.1